MFLFLLMLFDAVCVVCCALRLHYFVSCLAVIKLLFAFLLHCRGLMFLFHLLVQAKSFSRRSAADDTGTPREGKDRKQTTTRCPLYCRPAQISLQTCSNDCLPELTAREPASARRSMHKQDSVAKGEGNFTNFLTWSQIRENLLTVFSSSAFADIDRRHTRKFSSKMPHPSTQSQQQQTQPEELPAGSLISPVSARPRYGRCFVFVERLSLIRTYSCFLRPFSNSF